MLFAPLLGGAGSQMKAGEAREFVMRLVVAKASLSATYETIARTLYGFTDARHNALGSLNATFERMLDFGLSEYAKFNPDLRGFAYDTDVPGAVKNVSALHPLGRVAEPEELMGTIVYLASAASDYMTGQVVYVDGGRSCKA